MKFFVTMEKENVCFVDSINLVQRIPHVQKELAVNLKRS